MTARNQLHSLSKEMIGATKTDYLQDGRNHCVSIWITPDQTGYSFGRSGFL
jgi:hypothetical protein